MYITLSELIAILTFCVLLAGYISEQKRNNRQGCELVRLILNS